MQVLMLIFVTAFGGQAPAVASFASMEACRASIPAVRAFYEQSNTLNVPRARIECVETAR